MLLKNWSAVKNLLLVLSCILLFSTCKKNSDSDSNESKPDLSTRVTASLVSGFVTDENDAPVLNAAVVIGNKIIATDKYGYFEAGNIEVVKTAATVTVNKTGYFKAIKTFAAEAGKGAFFRIKLMPKTIVGTISAAVGGTVTLSNGLAIKFPAGAITDVTTNKPYTGDVRVSAKLISATDPDLNSIMPGDLRGVNSNNSLRLLTTYGMAAVELSGPAGEFLQISDGKKAILYMPIPASLQANAPASIPLWYFDENSGLWKEEGSAAKMGNMYVGEVSHFSFWNCDVPGTFVQFNCTVVNTAGQPIPNAQVKISVANNPANFRYGFTDTSGYVSGLVPDNAQLVLEIYSNTNCITPVYSQQFTTTTTAISLGTITITTASAQATVTGTVINCSGSPVTNGYIMLQSGSTLIRKQLSNTGTYSISMLLCNAASLNALLIAEDVTTSQQSTASAITITAGPNTIPPIQACGVSTQEFITYTVNGGSAVNYTQPGDSITVWGQGTTNYNISGAKNPYNSSSIIDFKFSRTGIAAGTVQNLTSFYIPVMGTGSSIPNPIAVNITEYGATGQFMSGNFSGVVNGAPPTNTPYTITCSFRVRRWF